MYNEVYAACPTCGKSAMTQVRQVVPGFGGFHLDDPECLAAQLTADQLQDLHDAVLDERFWCEACGQGWVPFPSAREADLARLELARKLFGKRG